MLLHKYSTAHDERIDKAFYQLCLHMEPEYHQFEFDLRACLSLADVAGKPLWSSAPAAN